MATVGLAIYGAYKLGEWIVGTIRESRKAKDGDASNEVTSLSPPLSRETQRKLQRYRKITCAHDSLALMHRMLPSLQETIDGRTSIALERHELKRLRGDTATAQRQQELWKAIQNKTLLRFFMTMLAESLLFSVTWLHMHWVASSPSSTIPSVLSSSQSTTTLYRSLFTTIISFLDRIEDRCHDAFLRRTDWDTHSDAALHMTYAKFKAGLDDCLACLLAGSEDTKNLWMQYVAYLEQCFGEESVNKDAFVAELLDLMESPLANEAFSAVLEAMYIDNSVRNLQQVFALKGELPLAQVIAKLSKQSFACDLDRLVVGLEEVQRISQVFFPEEI